MSSYPQIGVFLWMKAANMGLVYPAGKNLERGGGGNRLAGESDAIGGGRYEDGLAAAQAQGEVAFRLMVGERSGPFHTDECYEGVQCPEVFLCHGIGIIQRE